MKNTTDNKPAQAEGIYTATRKTSDGIDETKSYKTEKGLASYVKKHTGLDLVNGKATYVSEDGVSIIEITTAAENQAAAEVEEKPPIKAHCYECNHSWEIPREEGSKQENVLCPECGAWCIVRLHPDRERYVRGLGTTASGNDTLDINDSIARDLRGMTPQEVFEHGAKVILDTYCVHGQAVLPKSIRKALKEDLTYSGLVAYFTNKYSARNPGMQRMNVGNLLRTLSKNAAELAAIEIK